MLHDNKIWMAVGDRPVYLLPNQANRHGLIAGASGTGKTITLKVMAESFSALGVPVFLADIKGVWPECVCLAPTANYAAALARLGLGDSFSYSSFPTRFWDIYGEAGHPVKTTVTDMGPYLLSRLLDLTEVQTDALSMVFRIADDEGQLLLDLKDLRAMVRYVGRTEKALLTNMAASRRRPLAPCSVPCWRWRIAEAISSLASRRWTFLTGFAPTEPVTATSIFCTASSWRRIRSCTPLLCCGCCPSYMSRARSGRSGQAAYGVLLR